MTREDILREFAAGNEANEFSGWRTFDMADEIARLRAKLQAVREKVTTLPAFMPETRFGLTGVTMEKDADGEWLSRDDVLALLEDTP